MLFNNYYIINKSLKLIKSFILKPRKLYSKNIIKIMFFIIYKQNKLLVVYNNTFVMINNT